MEKNVVTIKDKYIISKAITEDALIVCTDKWKWVCEIGSEKSLGNGEIQFKLKDKSGNNGKK